MLGKGLIQILTRTLKKSFHFILFCFSKKSSSDNQIVSLKSEKICDGGSWLKLKSLLASNEVAFKNWWPFKEAGCGSDAVELWKQIWQNMSEEMPDWY